MKTRRLTELSLITAMALIVFVIELRFPDILPIPGVKLGLANIFTVYTVYRFSAKESLLMVLSRIILGAIFCTNVQAFIYSFCGAMLCLGGMLLIRKVIPKEYVWLCSIIGAVLHNTGQITAAVCMTRSPAVLFHYPVLIISGCIAGAFTGITAQLLLKRKLPGQTDNENRRMENESDIIT